MGINTLKQAPAQARRVSLRGKLVKWAHTNDVVGRKITFIIKPRNTRPKPRSESEKRAGQQRVTQAEVVRGGRSGLSGIKPIKELGASGTITLGECGAIEGTNTEGIGSAEAI